MRGVERSNSLVSIVIRTILAEIAEGKLVAQSHLPTEQQLSERLEVKTQVGLAAERVFFGTRRGARMRSVNDY